MLRGPWRSVDALCNPTTAGPEHLRVWLVDTVRQPNPPIFEAAHAAAQCFTSARKMRCMVSHIGYLTSKFLELAGTLHVIFKSFSPFSTCCVIMPVVWKRKYVKRSLYQAHHTSTFTTRDLQAATRERRLKPTSCILAFYACDC